MKRRRTTLFAAALALSVGLAALPASRAQTNGAPPQPGASARFALGGNAAEIPAEFIGNLVFLPVRLNEGQPCLFLLDSTAASTSIDPNRAAELGIRSSESVVLELAGVALALPALPQVPRQNFAAEVGRVYEGTLGKDFFESVVVEIDYARKTVRLYDPASYQYLGAGKPSHAPAGGAPEVQAKFSETGSKTVEGDFIVNTAIDVSVLIYERYADAHRLLASHLRTIPAMDQPLDERGNALLARLKLFQIGAVPVQEPIAEFSRRSPAAGSGARLAGEIGGGMLRRFNVVFDYAHGQIFLDPNSELHSDEIEDMSGISLIARGPGLKTFEVAEVRRGTPGSDAGVQKGDIIAGIDEDPAADLSLAEIHDLFRQLVRPYKLTIERNGQTLTLTMKLRRLL